MRQVRVSVLLVLCMWSTQVFGALQNPPRYKAEHASTVEAKWKLLETRIRGLVESSLKQMLPVLTRAETNISDPCYESFVQLVIGFKDSKLWAFKFLDAWGKPSGGQLMGTTSSYGDFDECLSLTLPGHDPSRSLLAKGKYCLMDVRPSLPTKPKLSSQYLPLLPPLDNFTSNLEIVDELRRQSWAFYQSALRIGMCLPSTCSDQDAQKIANAGAGYLGMNAEVRSCQVSEGMKFKVEHLFIIGVLSVFVSLTTISSVLDHYFSGCCGTSEDDKPSTFRRLVQAFSIPRNLEKTLAISPESESPVACLHGIRFLSMVWVILSHTYLVLDPTLYRHGVNFGEMGKDFAYQAIANSSLGVETFIFLTGVLMSFQLVQQVDRRGKKIFNIPLLVFHRVWRLLPSAMLAVAITILLPVLGSGPAWPEEMEIPARNCRNNWWQIMVFANNFVPFNDMCLFHTWYISVDMQLLVLGIIYFSLLFWKPVLAIALNVFYILLSVSCSTAIAWIMDLLPTGLMSAPDREATSLAAQYTYFLPINQLGIYCLGLGLGTFLARKRDIRIPKPVQVLGWVFAITINMSICYGILLWNRGRIPNRLESAAYAGLHRTCWGLGLAWVTFICANKKGGLINKLLSWSGFGPFNRLTFLVYLFHILVISYFLGSLRGVLDLSHPMIIWIFFGNLTITFCVALVLRLLYEAPLTEMEHLICERLIRRMDTDTKKVKQGEDNEGQEPDANPVISRL